jgi:uncharacterized flavoprotein (TIGR03862 family)
MHVRSRQLARLAPQGAGCHIKVMTDHRKAAVVGGGPAGLMAAEVLACANIAVTVYERMPSLGRKLLMAGRGGLNLTHSEEPATFLSRYGTAEPHLRGVLAAFPPERLQRWSAELGQPTFTGTSGRVFPQAMKASPLLRAWLRRLDGLGVKVALRHRWTGWDDNGALLFDTPNGVARAMPDVTVLALGGASWPRLGSDGGWAEVLAREGIAITPLRPSNCGMRVAWSDRFRDRFAGQPLKTIALSFGGDRVRGEAVITRDGLEGGAVYALSPALREAIDDAGEAALTIDLLPDLELDAVTRRLGVPRGKQSLSNVLRKSLSLSPAAIGLAQEVTDGKLGALAPEAMAALLKAAPVILTGVASIERAISTAGGVTFDAVDDAFMLKAKPGVFVAGEMLDWEAPTGGYLLQACFATGGAAAEGAVRYLASLKVVQPA